MKHFSIKLRKLLLCDYVYYVLLILSIIYISIYFKNYIPHHKYNTNDNNFILKIIDYKTDGDKLSLTFEESLVGTYYFKTIKEKEDILSKLELGDIYEIKGKLKEPNSNTIPNVFNYKKYLNNKEIHYILSIEELKLKSKSKNKFFKIKNKFYDRVNSLSSKDYMYAFILGKAYYIDNESYNNYKINGVTHLFALSGLHVTMFSNIILSVLKKLKLNEILSFFITSIFLIFFAFIASFTPSILRATIFFILSNLNKIYYTFVKPKYLLYITFIVLILINPFYIFNIGFILSFTITFFILLFNENIKIKNNILSMLIISIVSFFSSLPIIINMTYEINMIGFFNNLIFIPFVSNIVFPLALLTYIFNFLSPVLVIITNVMEKISSISSFILNITIYFSKLNTIEIVIYYILLIIIIKKKTKYFLIITYMIFLYLKPNFDKNNYIYFLDVGQGDSALIITENKETILIDTGGKINYSNEKWKEKNKNFNSMKDSIIPFMKSIGIKKLNHLILTHGDYDHMGEAINLVENFKVEKVVFNCGEFNELEQDLIKVLAKKKIPYYSCIKELNIDDNKLYFLNNKDYGNENDNSSVIYTELNNHKFLFMGDAGVEVEEDLIEKYNLKDIDVLKVGHHGSKTSSGKKFIDEIEHKYSVISVGKNNRYGHPNKEVLSNLNNSKIYRTDQDGSIMFKIKNGKLKIETCVP